MERRSVFLKTLMLAFLAGTLSLTGCSGDDGANGLNGNDVPSTTVDNLQAQIDAAVANVKPESCAICHNGNLVGNGDMHQAAYDELFQQGVVVIDPATVNYNFSGGNDVVTFEMTKNGDNFNCTQADALSIYFTEYTGVKGAEFTSIDTNADGDGDSLSIGTQATSSQASTLSYNDANNVCTSTKTASARGDLSAIPGIIVIYGQDELIQSISEAHISLAKYPFAALLKIGTVDYVSAANVTGCEKCHTTPYYKHGYITGDIGAGVGNLDFYSCKACHLDNNNGGHMAWQLSVDNPQRWAELVELANAAIAVGDTAHNSVEKNMTPEEKAMYAYTTRVMNDVHMSHSMEFPYPQSMRNCATCHAGKLAETMVDDNFIVETCKSCHPQTGGTDTANADGVFAVDTTGMALRTLMPVSHANFALDGSVVCKNCHSAVAGVGAPLFSTIHTGYDPKIYDATGTKYADNITASIDSVTVTGNVLDITLSATGSVGAVASTSITPTVMVSFYGYDSKDYIISNHTADGTLRCIDRRGNPGGCTIEKTFGTDNPLFTEIDADGSDGTWEVSLDMSSWVAPDPTVLGSITDLIASGVIKQAEVAFRPALIDAAGVTLGLNAVTKTVDVSADGVDPFIANYYQGSNAIVSEAGITTTANGTTKGCNSCHDQLATSFHSGDRGGSIVVCRMCHVVTSGGSHLQGQSRSIDSYVHAIHRFQAFDVDSIDFTDPVEAAHYEEHIGFLFPDFAVVNCKACHLAGKFNVPDQSKSMPGVLSATDTTSGVVPANTPSVVVGPAARACGACHRAEFINDNDPIEFIAFNQHLKDFGYRVEYTSAAVLYGIIDTIMSMFQ